MVRHSFLIRRIGGSSPPGSNYIFMLKFLIVWLYKQYLRFSIFYKNKKILGFFSKLEEANNKCLINCISWFCLSNHIYLKYKPFLQKREFISLSIKSIYLCLIILSKYIYYKKLYILIYGGYFSFLIYIPIIFLLFLLSYILYYYYLVNYLISAGEIIYSWVFAFLFGLLIDQIVLLICKYTIYSF